VPYLVNYKPSENFDQKTKQIHHLGRRAYFTMGGVFETEHDIKIKPSVLVKKEGDAPIQYDLNVNFLFNEIFWIGASYRSDEAIVALFEYQINRKFRVGYSYDITLGGISKYNSGSHELMLGYDFGYPVLKIKSPRYF
jgi:type IX secretion system PorP/SprF family membrane protein